MGEGAPGGHLAGARPTPAAATPSVSGDVNPIHLSGLTAKAFGFKRAIAHGMWVKARALGRAVGPPARRARRRRRSSASRCCCPRPSLLATAARRPPDGWDLAVRNATTGTEHLEGTRPSGPGENLTTCGAARAAPHVSLRSRPPLLPQGPRPSSPGTCRVRRGEKRLVGVAEQRRRPAPPGDASGDPGHGTGSSRAHHLSNPAGRRTSGGVHPRVLDPRPGGARRRVGHDRTPAPITSADDYCVAASDDAGGPHVRRPSTTASARRTSPSSVVRAARTVPPPTGAPPRRWTRSSRSPAGQVFSFHVGGAADRRHSGGTSADAAGGERPRGADHRDRRRGRGLLAHAGRRGCRRLGQGRRTAPAPRAAPVAARPASTPTHYTVEGAGVADPFHGSSERPGQRQRLGPAAAWWLGGRARLRRPLRPQRPHRRRPRHLGHRRVLPEDGDQVTAAPTGC